MSNLPIINVTLSTISTGPDKRDDSAHGDRYVDELREWIATHIAPTDDPRPRRERFAAAWYEIGVRAAYDAGRITRAEAGELLRVKP